jgi:transcriptional regulator with XRE-family HTH domain
MIRSWRRHGLADHEIADRIGITKSTLWAWAAKYPDFSDSLKRGKADRVARVEDALEDSAVGYYRDEVTRERMFNKKTGEFEMVETKRVTKWFAPSQTAQIFYLKNQDPETWKDRPEPTQDQALTNAAEILGDIGSAIE